MEQGYHATTVDQIADAADMSTRNFFRYFDSKEQVLFAWQQERDREILEAVAARPLTESPLTALREGLLSVISRYQDKNFIKLMQLVRVTPTLRAYQQEIEEPLERGLAEAVAARQDGGAASDLRPRILGAITLRLLHVAVDDWLEGGGGKDLVEHIHRAFAIVAGVERDTPRRRRAAR